MISFHNRIDRKDSNCPVCKKPKEEHSPVEAQACFNKIRDFNTNGLN